MSNYQGYENLEMDGEDRITELERNMVTLNTEQEITGKKIFDSVVIHDLSVNSQTTFATEDGIIHQLKDNTGGDTLDYGNYATYSDGNVKYKGIINKAGTDKFYVFHNQSNEPAVSLDLNTQGLGTMVVRDPQQDNEVATRGYVTSHGGGNYLPLSGGTMSGNINMNSNKVNDVYFLKFNGQWNHSFLTFKDDHKLTMGSWNTSNEDIDPFIHLNDTDSFKLIELMKDINLHGNINVLNNKRITGLQTPVGNSEPATKAYVDSHTGGNYLPLSGGTLTGDLTFGLERKINLGNGNRLTTLVNNDIVFYKGSGSTKFFAINENENYTSQRLNMNSNKIVNVSNGTDGGDAVNKNQLDTKLNKAGDTMTGPLNFPITFNIIRCCYYLT